MNEREYKETTALIDNLDIAQVVAMVSSTEGLIKILRVIIVIINVIISFLSSRKD